MPGGTIFLMRKMFTKMKSENTYSVKEQAATIIIRKIYLKTNMKVNDI